MKIFSPAFVVCLFISLGCSITGAQAQTFYEELFTNETGASRQLRGYQWTSYAGPAATVTGAGFSINDGPGNPSGPPGYLAMQVKENPDGMLVAATTGLQLKLPSGAIIRWRMNSADRNAAVRLLIEIGGKWYASAEDFPAVMGNAENLAAASGADVEKSVPFTSEAKDWKEFTLKPNASLALGETPAANLPSTPLTGIGFFVTARSGAVTRIDTLEIVPAGTAPRP